MLPGMEIFFDPPDGVFMAGGFVKGRVVLDIGKPTVAQQVVLELNGETRNGWVNKVSDNIYDTYNIHLQLSLPVLQSALSLSVGQHSLPFHGPLPDSLPSSFEGDFGYTRYTARACFTFAGSSGKQKASSVERRFSVIALLNLAHNPATKRPAQDSDATSFHCCCCIPLGTVSTTVSTPKNGYLPNEVINVTAEIHNGSRKQIHSQIVLIQHARFTAGSVFENAEDVKETFYNITTILRAIVQPRRTMSQKEAISVPRVIPTSQQNIIMIRYILQVKIEPGIELEMPIIIGNMDSSVK